MKTSSTPADDLQKVVVDEIPAAERISELAKAVGLELVEPTQEALTKAAIREIHVLRKASADLLASPAAPKGVLRAVVVDKAVDAGGEAKEPAPVVKSDGSTDDVATLVKAAQARPIRLGADDDASRTRVAHRPTGDAA